MKKMYSLTTLTHYLNETYGKKKSGESFRTYDTQGYIRRGYLPKYLGEVKIIPIKGMPGKFYELKSK